MKSGKCPKCNSTEIFASYGKSSLDSGLSTGDGQPLLRLRTAKSGLFGDDYKMLEMETYVCRACGYVEMFVDDASRERLQAVALDTKRWLKV